MDILNINLQVKNTKTPAQLKLLCALFHVGLGTGAGQPQHQSQAKYLVSGIWYINGTGTGMVPVK